MSNKPRLLIIDFTDFFGGGQKFIQNLSSSLRNEYIFYYAISSIKLIENLQSNNVLYIEGKLSKSLHSVIKINKFISKNNIDISILNGNRAIYFSSLFSWAVVKIAYKHTSNNAFKGVLKKMLASVFLNINYLFCNKVVLLYEKSRKEVFFNKRNVHVVPNFVTVENSGEVNRSLNNDCIRITTISRLDPDKGLDWLLLCFYETQKLSGRSIELVIAGDGPSKVSLEALSLKLGIKNITFLGFIDSVATLLNSSDIFVLPSKFESFPLTILEAMNYNLPIVATNTGGISELVQHNLNGFVVEFNDSHSLSKYLLALIENKERRILMGTASYHRAMNHFTERHFKEKLVKVLEK
ncbi:MAG TPA: glycosyltransferase [Pedobacter sp.]|jgi:glycosyltransferase involved in cell wall biosynthesis